MNKIIFFFILLTGQIIFCLEENFNKSSFNQIHSETKEPVNKSWKDHLKEHLNKASDWLKRKSFFKDRNVTYKGDDTSEPLLMHDSFDQSEQPMKAEKVEDEESLIDEQKNESREEELALEHILNNLDKQSSIGLDTIAKISPNDFLKVFNSSEGLGSIKKILDTPSFLEKLNEAQVKTIFEYLVEKQSEDSYKNELIKMLSDSTLFSKISDEKFDKGLTLLISVPKITPDVFNNSQVAENILDLF